MDTGFLSAKPKPHTDAFDGDWYEVESSMRHFEGGQGATSHAIVQVPAESEEEGGNPETRI